MLRRAGLDLTTYEGAKSRSSAVNSRINNASRPMPPRGLIDKASRDLIAQWIKDGLKKE